MTYAGLSGYIPCFIFLDLTTCDLMFFYIMLIVRASLVAAVMRISCL